MIIDDNLVIAVAFQLLDDKISSPGNSFSVVVTEAEEDGFGLFICKNDWRFGF